MRKVIVRKTEESWLYANWYILAQELELIKMEELCLTIIRKSQAYNTMAKLLIINNQPRFQLYNLSQIFVDFSFDIFQLSTR